MADIPVNGLRDFDREKKAALAEDLSRKGSIDNFIISLVNSINEKPFFFTTSSCSGRTIVVASNLKHKTIKKGCEWLYVTHGQANVVELLEALLNKPCEEASLKFEPFIAHVRASDLEHARELLQIAVSSGYRNSGISLGKSGKLIVAVRSTSSLEVPIISEGKRLVSDEYIQYLCSVADRKMKENHGLINRFHANFVDFMQTKLAHPPPQKPEVYRSSHERLSKPRKHCEVEEPSDVFGESLGLFHGS